MKLLTDEEFHSTFFGPMRNITGSPLPAGIWEYADEIIESEYQSFSEWDWRVQYIYETGNKKYHHISIPAPKDNAYLVIVLDPKAKEFIGHHILDLNEKYGLNET
ncbi:MAG: hypothetical protein AAF431_12890 [Pseudomonadota bacterium]